MIGKISIAQVRTQVRISQRLSFGLTVRTAFRQASPAGLLLNHSSSLCTSLSFFTQLPISLLCFSQTHLLCTDSEYE